MSGNQRTGYGSPQKILAFIKCVGAKHRKHIVAHKFLAKILNKNLADTQRFGLLAGRFHLLPLANIGGKSDHITSILILQPLQDNRGIKTSRVGKDRLFDCLHDVFRLLARGA